MKDLIWTVIVVWLVYQVVNLFKRIPASSKSGSENSANQQSDHVNTPPEQDIKKAVKKHLDKTGDYVDYEEIK